MKINNKPMSALPSVTDASADAGRSCVCLFGLYTILAEGSPCRRGRPVSSPPSHHLIIGFYHREPFLRFGKYVRETASFQQKEPPLRSGPR